MIYPREDEYLREDLEAIFDEFMEIVSSCPSSFIVHWAWNRGVRASTNTGKFNFTTARIPRGYLYEILTKLWKSYPRVHPRSSFIGHGTGV